MIMRRIAVICGAALIISWVAHLACVSYFLSTRPPVMQSNEGRTVAFHSNQLVVYLTEQEHLLVRLSFWLPFGAIVIVLILKNLFPSRISN